MKPSDTLQAAGGSRGDDEPCDWLDACCEEGQVEFDDDCYVEDGVWNVVVVDGVAYTYCNSARHPGLLTNRQVREAVTT